MKQALSLNLKNQRLEGKVHALNPLEETVVNRKFPLMVSAKREACMCCGSSGGSSEMTQKQDGRWQRMGLVLHARARPRLHMS